MKKTRYHHHTSSTKVQSIWNIKETTTRRTLCIKIAKSQHSTRLGSLVVPAIKKNCRYCARVAAAPQWWEKRAQDLQFVLLQRFYNGLFGLLGGLCFMTWQVWNRTAGCFLRSLFVLNWVYCGFLDVWSSLQGFWHVLVDWGCFDSALFIEVLSIAVSLFI